MSGEEETIADTSGRVAILPSTGGSLQDLNWRDARIRLTTKRLLIGFSSGKTKAIPHDQIQDIGDPFDGTQAVSEVAGYVGLYLHDPVLLIAPEQREAFVFDLHTALLDGHFSLARYPAKEGGVPSDQPWEDARLAVMDRSLRVTTERGAQTTIPLDAVGPLRVTEDRVLDEDRTIVKVVHEVEGTVVETHLAGPPSHARHIESFLSIGSRANHPDLELDRREWEIVVALYSGITPFELPRFLDESVEEVEETFERLIERDVLEPVRRRLEVDVAPGGRILATETEPEEATQESADAQGDEHPEEQANQA